jgi:hypothetical protein
MGRRTLWAVEEIEICGLIGRSIGIVLHSPRVGSKRYEKSQGLMLTPTVARNLADLVDRPEHTP